MAMRADEAPRRRIQTPGADREPRTVAPGEPANCAIASLLESHGPRIHGLALRLCGNRADAEDLVQDVFLQAFRRWHTYRGEADAGAWLSAIARRAAIRRLRRRRGDARRAPAFSQLLPWTETSISSLVADPRSRSAPIEAQRGEAVAAVQAAIANLPEHLRVPLVLKEVMELSLAETAKFLGLKAETIKTRLHRARLLLRQVLETTTPRSPAPAPIYEKQVCLDLLKAKLAAMDEGRDASLGRTRSEMCRRCRAVFAELDIVQDACATLAGEPIPEGLRENILKAVTAATGSASSSRARRGRPPLRSGRQRASAGA